MLSRRTLLVSASAGLAATSQQTGIVFTGRGRSGFLNPDRRLEWISENGRGLRRVPLPEDPGAGFGLYGFFRDGRALLQSLALPEGWQTQTFDEYYPRSRTRIWAADLTAGRVEELCTRDRLSSFCSPVCILPGEARLAATVLLNGKSVLYTMNLDGTEPRALTGPGEFVYGVSLSPDGARFAFHCDYRIQTCRVDGSDRRELAAERGVIYFSSSWSPDGEWVLFQACDGRQDPAHDWSRIGIVGGRGGRPVRWLTPPAEAWFGASYGQPGNPGGGSNQPQWAPDNRGPMSVLYVRRIAGSVTPWVFAAGRRDTDHFNRDYRPETARGGAHLTAIDVATGKQTHVTAPREGVWDFRPAFSPDGRRICFLRAPVGQPPELWIARSNGGKARALTHGMRGAGCEHPSWTR